MVNNKSELIKQLTVPWGMGGQVVVEVVGIGSEALNSGLGKESESVRCSVVSDSL